MADVEHGIGGGGYRDAPVLIVVAADIERGLEVTVPSSIFPATQNLLLAATALGLGVRAHDHLDGRSPSDLQAMLDLPAHVVPAGRHPGRPPGQAARPVHAATRSPQHTHRDRYGTPW